MSLPDCACQRPPGTPPQQSALYLIGTAQSGTSACGCGTTSLHTGSSLSDPIAVSPPAAPAPRAERKSGWLTRATSPSRKSLHTCELVSLRDFTASKGCLRKQRSVQGQRTRGLLRALPSMCRVLSAASITPAMSYGTTIVTPIPAQRRAKWSRLAIIPAVVAALALGLVVAVSYSRNDSTELSDVHLHSSKLDAVADALLKHAGTASKLPTIPEAVSAEGRGGR